MTLFCRKEGLKLNIIAHKSKDGREQSLQEHGQNVAKMAASFAAPFGGEKFAERIGISHDAGKDTVGFQQYIQEENAVKAESKKEDDSE